VTIGLRRQLTKCSVLRVITRLNIGGPGRHVLTLSRATPDIPSVVACGLPTPDEGELDITGVDVVRVPLTRPVSPLKDVRAVAAVKGMITTLNPRIVESHMAKAGFATRMAVACLRSRPATIHVFHGHVLEGYFSPVVENAYTAAERFLAKKTDLLVTVSEQTRDSLLSLRVGRPEQYRVVHLGLDLGPFVSQVGTPGTLRQALSLGPDVPLIGVAARLVPIKDHAVLLDTIVRVPDAHLAIMGDGPLKASLAKQSEELGLARRVHFLGWWSDMPGAFADCDVVVLTSRNEGTPVSLIEAMATGKPVVATSVGGMSAVVEDGETGFLVPPGDRGALAERLAVVLSDRVLAHKLGMKASAVATKRFGLRRMVEDMRAIYTELSA
jgi:glycosyltransferase involved in cell wall biosynthesis